jgi:hypothetical protein
MSRALAPKGGNDRVYTPLELSRLIVYHFGVQGRRLDPCRGKGAFYRSMLEYSPNGFVEWCEIDEEVDFLTTEITQHYDWVVTNPPWSQLRAFLKKSMEVADNVVFLCLVNAFFMKARQADMKAAGFGMKEILFVPTPLKPWPQTGFSLGAVHIQRGYTGLVKFSHLEEI